MLAQARPFCHRRSHLDNRTARDIRRYGRLHGQARTHRRPSRSGRSAPDPEFGTDERLAAATVYSVLWWARLQGRPDDVEDPQNGQSTARSTWARMSRRRDRTSGSRSDHAAARTCWWSMLSAGQKLTASPRWPRSPRANSPARPVRPEGAPSVAFPDLREMAPRRLAQSSRPRVSLPA